MEQHTQSVAAHYGRRGIAAGILDALKRAGKDLDRLTVDDLAPADEFHTRGREATVELASLAAVAPDMHVVDVGSGVGGPARYLAATFGCRVTGIDLTPAFGEAATVLTERLGLADRVGFETGSALDMPFADASFELAWTMQMQMNIADKPRLYAEIHRVLKPGGRLVFQDIVKGPGGEIHTPVPWASDPGLSFLVPPEDLRRTIAGAGFTEVVWRDTSEANRDWLRRQAKPPEGSDEPILGIHLVIGPDARQKRANSSRSLMENRTGYVQGVYEKPVR